MPESRERCRDLREFRAQPLLIIGLSGLLALSRTELAGKKQGIRFLTVRLGFRGVETQHAASHGWEPRIHAVGAGFVMV